MPDPDTDEPKRLDMSQMPPDPGRAGGSAGRRPVPGSPVPQTAQPGQRFSINDMPPPKAGPDTAPTDSRGLGELLWQGVKDRAGEYWKKKGEDFDADMKRRKEWREANPGVLAPVGKMAKDAANIVADTASFGLADKAVAGGRSILNKTSYDDELARARANTDDSMKAQGATPLALASGIPAARALGGAYSALRLPQVGGLLGAGAQGAAYGALNEAGHTDADGPGPYALNATIGAGFGAAEGMGLHSLLGRLIPKSALNRSAENMLVGAGATEQGTRDTIRRLGPQAMIAEGSPGGFSLTQGIVGEGGPNAAPVVAAIEDRARGAGDRLRDTLDQNIGTPLIRPGEAHERLREAKRALGPEYERLFVGRTVDVAPVIAQIDAELNNPATGGRTAVGPDRDTLMYARNLLVQHPGQDALPPTPSVNGGLYTDPRTGRLMSNPSTPGTPGQSYVPPTLLDDPKGVQSAKRAINRRQDFADSPFQPPLPSHEAVSNRILSIVGRGLRDVLGTVPGYNAVSNESQRLLLRGGAIEKGQDIFKKKMSLDEYERAGDMATGDPAGRKFGAQTAVHDLVGGAPGDKQGITAVSRAFTTPDKRAKLETEFGPQAVENINQAVNTERLFNRTERANINGSETNARGQAVESLRQQLPKGSIISSANSMDVTKALGYAWDTARRINAGTLTAGQRELAREQIGRALSLRGAELETFLNRLAEDAAKPRALSQTTGNVLPGLLNQTSDANWVNFVGANPHRPPDDGSPSGLNITIRK